MATRCWVEMTAHFSCPCTHRVAPSVRRFREDSIDALLGEEEGEGPSEPEAGTDGGTFEDEVSCVLLACRFVNVIE